MAQGCDGEALPDEPQRAPSRPGAALDGVHAQEAAFYDRRHAGAQKRASVVGTASYQHTLMRCAPAAASQATARRLTTAHPRRSVRTMSDSGLAARIKAIERAKGQHAVVKMRLFARVLFLEARRPSRPPAARAALTRSPAGV